MELQQKRINYNTLFWAFILFQFTIFYIVIYFSPMENDEYAYSCIFATSERIQNFTDILRSMKHLYLMWSGRIIFNGLFLQSLLLFGKGYIALVSALAYSLLGIFMFQWNGIRTRFAKNEAIFCMIFYFILWFLLPSFDSITWIAGAANYLWPFIFCFLFLFPYMYIVRKINIKTKIYHYVFPLIAFIAGLSTEIFCAFGGVAVIILLLTAVNRRIKIPRYLWIGLVFYITGAAILFTAPGNFNRAAQNPNTPLWDNLAFSLRMLQNTYFYLITVAFAIVALFMIWNVLSKNKRDLSAMYALFTGAILSVLLGAVTPEFYDRELIPAAIIILMIIIYFSQSFIEAKKIENRYVLGTAVLLMLIMVISQFEVVGTFSDINTQMINREAIVRENIIKGVYNISVPPLRIPPSRYVHYLDITDDPNYAANYYIATYWGVDSIVLNTSPIKTIELTDKEISSLPVKDANGINYGYHGMNLDYCNNQIEKQQGEISVDPNASQTILSGWAVDSLTGSEAGNLYLKIGNHCIPCKYGKDSFSLEQAYNNIRYYHCGFSITIGTAELESAREIEFIVISHDGTYKYPPIVYKIKNSLPFQQALSSPS